MDQAPAAMTLAELIRTRKGERSFSRLADDCGGVPAGRRLQQMATRPLKNFPDPDTITALARGLGTTPLEVLQSAAASLGIDAGGPSAHDLILPGAGTLAPALREIVYSVATRLMALEREAA